VLISTSYNFVLNIL